MTIDERLEVLTTNIESLHASVHELYGANQEQTRQIAELAATAREHTKQLLQDAEHIRALARIADMHDRRLTKLEGGQA